MFRLISTFLLATSFMFSAVGAHGEPAVDGGEQFSVALHDDGTVLSWGRNTFGQLGDGTTTLRLYPVRVPDLTQVRTIAAGGSHVLALQRDGSVWAWGQNLFGQLGDGTTVNRLRPVKIQTLTNIEAIAAGREFSVALDGNGDIWVWGRNSVGQLGDGSATNRLAPVKLSRPAGDANLRFVGIAAGGYHVLAVTNSGVVYAWGDNMFGQLGLTDTAPKNVPTLIAGMSGVKSVYAGYGQSYAIVAVTSPTAVNVLKVWGLNNFNQLGDSLTASIFAPKELTAITGFSELTVGDSHVFGRTQSGIVYRWGYNRFKQLGNGASDNVAAPSPPVEGAADTNLNGYVKLGAGTDHSLGMSAIGDVYSWGDNTYGQLGNKTNAAAAKPAPVTGIAGTGTLNLLQPLDLNSDTTPDTFSFAAINDTGLQSEIRSQEIVISGINTGTPLTIVDGEYQINPASPIDPAAFTAAPGTLHAGDRLIVRHWSAATNGTRTTTAVTIGGVTANFESTTLNSGGAAAGGGGGCTVATGQRDLSLLAAVALVSAFSRLRRRRPAR